MAEKPAEEAEPGREQERGRYEDLLEVGPEERETVREFAYGGKRHTVRIAQVNFAESLQMASECQGPDGKVDGPKLTIATLRKCTLLVDGRKPDNAFWVSIRPELGAKLAEAVMSETGVQEGVLGNSGAP